MSDKTRTSINLRDDHRDWLDKNGYNRSELINQLLDEYRSGEFGMETAIAEYRKRQIDAEIESLEKQLEIKKGERQDITENTTTEDEEQKQHWKEAVGNIEPPAHLRTTETTPDPEEWEPPIGNKKVEIYAERLGMSREEFSKQFPEKRREYNAE